MTYRAFFLFFLTVNIALSNTGYIESTGEKKVYKVGDNFYGKLVLSPFNELVSSLDLKNKELVGGLYVIDVSEIYYSQNNHEALVVEFLAVVKNKIDAKRSYTFSTSKDYSLELREVSFEGEAPKEKEFLIEEHKSEEFDAFYFFLFLVIGSFSIVLFAYFLFKFAKEKANKKKIEEFVRKLEKVKKREDLEKIYWDRKFWIKKVSFDKNLWDNFCKDLNELQYKKLWNEEEEKLLQKNFEKFKETVKIDGV